MRIGSIAQLTTSLCSVPGITPRPPAMFIGEAGVKEPIEPKGICDMKPEWVGESRRTARWRCDCGATTFSVIQEDCTLTLTCTRCDQEWEWDQE